MVDRYLLGNKLGEGTNGSVYLAKDSQTNIMYVAKLMKMKDEGSKEKIRRQIGIPSLLKGHKNVSSIVESFSYNSWTVIILEYIQGKDLAESEIPKNWTLKLDLLYQLVDGLQFIHSKGVAHRDIKAENVILKENIPIYIDYDVSCTPCLEEYKCNIQIAGTPVYISPEIWLHNLNFLFESDVYSLGILFYYLVNDKEFPYDDSDINQLRSDVIKGEMTNSNSGLVPLDALICLMIKTDPMLRPSLSKIKDILQKLIKSV